jgi:hypothetical protein
MTRLLLPFVLIALFFASEAKAQGFVVDGVIHDSATLAPLPGIAVFIRDDATNELISPGELVDPGSQGRVTGADGRYALAIRTSRRFRLVLERPSETFSFPSLKKPPIAAAERGVYGGFACEEIPCTGGQVAANTAPIERSPYALRFASGPGNNARNNHVPVDDVASLIETRLIVDRSRARVGDHLDITVEIASNLPEPLLESQVAIALPPELRFLPGTVRFAEDRPNAEFGPPPFPPLQSGLLLQLPARALPAGTSRARWRFLARVAAKKHDGRLELTAHLERGGGIRLSNEAVARIAVDDDPVLEESTILGSVFCEDDDGKKGWRDAIEEGLFGARVYLDNGFSAASDLDGLFHFTNVKSGNHLVKLDEGSLPPGSIPLGPTRVQLHLTPGLPAKIRFPIRCELDVVEDPTRVTRGEKQAATEAPAAVQRTLELSYDFELGIFTLGGRPDEMTSVTLAGAQLGADAKMIRFFPGLAPSYTPTRWLIRVEEADATGKAIRAVKEPLTGRGLPPLFVDLLVERPGIYRAQLEIDSGDYDRGVSEPIFVITSTATTERVDLKKFLARATEADAKQVLALLPRELPLVFEGHWDESPLAEDESRALAEKMRMQAVKLGLSQDLIEVTGRGSAEPLVPAISPRARRQNRRVEIYTTEKVERVAKKPRLPVLPPVEELFTVTVDGIVAELPIPEGGVQGTYTLDLDTPAQLELTFRDSSGGSATARRVITPGRVVRPVERAPIAPVIDVANGRLRFDELELPLPVFAAQIKKLRAENERLTVELSNFDSVAAYRVTLERRDGTVLADAAGLGAPPAAVTLSSTIAARTPTLLRFVASNEDGIHFQQKTIELPPLSQGIVMQIPSVQLAPVARSGHINLSEGTVSPSERVLSIGENDIVLLPLVELAALPESHERYLEGESDLSKAPAAETMLFLPREGEELTQLEAPVRGETRPENKILINDEPVIVRADGRFSALVPLEPGENRLVIESEDELGNRARFERVVRTSSSAHFLMAMGDVVLSGRNADLAGSNEHTRVNLGSVALDGRAVAFGKARFIAPGPFQRISLLGHVDTAELGRPEILRQLDDPLRLLPAFGDASLEVQEIPGHRALYLEIQADHSHLSVGSKTTSISSFGDDSLFVFRRSGFGVHADLAKGFGEHDETRIQGAFLGGEDGVLRGHDELQGTGGAIFWLSKKEIVEGSESVRLVIRDRDTGMVLHSEDQLRDVDYEFRPREGRVMMREPVSHAAGLASPGMNRSLALNGHPIYLVVDYSYQVSALSESSFGVQLREELYDQFEVYGAVAGEQNSGENYRLYGAGLAWRPSLVSSIELEWARSSGTTELGALSTDGGLSFRSLTPTPSLAPNNVFPGSGGTDAFFASATLGFADLVEDLGTYDPGFLRAYFGIAGLEFSSLSSARDAGKMRLGLSARYAVNAELAFHANADSVQTTLPFDVLGGSEMSAMRRTLAVAGGDWSRDANAAGLEIAYLHTASEALEGSLAGVTARYERRVTDALRIGLSQDVLLGDDPLLSTGTGGRLASIASVSYDVGEALTLSLAEMLRWDGENATQLGAKVRVDENFSTYVAERLSGGAAGTRLTTVIGAEDMVAEGSRTYAEYQIDGAHASLSRAVLGMDNRWKLADGLELSLGYERAQRLGDSSQAVAEARYSGPLGGIAATLDGFRGPSSNEPTLLQGAASRDALSVGLSFTQLDRVKLASRVELRVDSDDRQGAREFFVVGTHHGMAISVNQDISLLGRLTYQRAEDTALERLHAQLLEWSMGAALRPRSEDWFTLLLRYTRQKILRPRDVDVFFREETRDAVAVEPILDTPWNVQLVEKVALVANTSRLDGGAVHSGLNALWINRLNARVFEQFEGGLEYRMLADLSLNTVERGFLVEAGWVPDERVRVGLGYNFTSFSDDELTTTNRDAGGPFLRITGRY